MIDLDSAAQQLADDFAAGFAPGERPLPADVLVVADPAAARVRCGLEMPDEMTGGADGDEEFPGEAWNHLLASTAGELGYQLQRAAGSGETSMRAADLAGDLCRRFDPSLTRMGLFDFSDTTEQCCKIALIHRALAGGSDDLGERLIRIMAAGAIPCGLDGPWPGGRLVALWPHPRQPAVESAA